MPPLRVQPFHSLTYQRPDLESIAERYRRARLRMRLAMKPESAIQAVEEAHAVSLEYDSAATLASIQHDQQPHDAAAREEVEFFRRSDTDVALMEQAFFQAMTASRFRDALTERFGDRVMSIATLLHDTVQPSVTQELTEERQLIGQYQRLLSDARIHLDDRAVPLSDIPRRLLSADRSIRRYAWLARADWMTIHKVELDRILTDLISVRTRLAKKLGYNSFIPVAARRLQRTGFRADDYTELRALIQTYVVPVTREIRRLQRRRLGYEFLAPWDLQILLPDGGPQAGQLDENLPAAVAALTGDMTGQHPSLLATLLDAGYVDWQERPGKSSESSCRLIYEAGVPFIQVNGCRTAQDVFTLLHETGHAYAAWRSLPGMTLKRTHAPVADTAEIHAMAMEVLSYPYLDRLFGRESETVALTHMSQALLQIPADCLVDEFEYRLYAQPQLSAVERDQIWLELMALYQPDLLDTDEVPPDLIQPWALQSLIVQRPFASASRVTGQLSALDLWHQSRQAIGQAFNVYDQLCAMGGRSELRELLIQTGLQSPFERDTIKRLVYQVCDFLSL